MITAVLNILEKSHQKTMLEQFSRYTPFQLLVMTLLSARAKDSTTIPVVRELFRQYPEPKDFVNMPQEELEKRIYRIGFYRAKARHIKELSRILIEQYHSIVPDTLEELTSLPGVGRKTANCMLAYVFGKPAIAVDVHVHRIANRLGWVHTKTPEETEHALQKIVSRKEWRNINRLLVGHGQTICLSRTPRCSFCPVQEYCSYARSSSRKRTP